MHIFVRGLDGQSTRADVAPDFSVLDVKELLCHGACLRPEGSVSKALGVPPPHVKLMWGCKELTDSCTLTECRVKSGMTLDIFPCYLCAAQVYVQKDWERLEGPGLQGDGRRFISEPWVHRNLLTASHLKDWVAATCDIDATDVVVEMPDGKPVADDFCDWVSLLGGGGDCGVSVTAFNYADAPCADVSVVVGEEVFPATREVLLWVPFFAAALSGSGEDEFRCVEVKGVDLETFQLVWRVICEEDNSEVLDYINCDLPEDRLWSVLAAAHLLGMKSLHRSVGLRLQDLLASSIAPDTAASWVALAQQNKAPHLVKACLDFVAKHGREVMLSMAGQDWSGDMASYESIVLAAMQSAAGSSSNGGA